jgi:GxxExxY protein
MLIYKEMCYEIVGIAQEVHRALGPGFLEGVYERALLHEFGLRKIPAKRQLPLPVLYKGVQLGKYRPDIVVDNKIILEVKAVSVLMAAHMAQAIHYLTATGLRLAILLNFGTESLQFKRVIK